MYKKVENIDQFNHYFHQPSYHPLVSVGRLQDADLSLFAPTDFGMYCVVLMEVDFGELVLRDTCMHYRAGTMFTMKPGDVVSMNLDGRVKPHGLMLAFRPELLNGTGLGRDFYMFNFFDYKVAEALELYDTERRVIINCFNNINTELQAPDDEFTSHMLRLGIGQMLTFCRRFYERQFDTGTMHSSDIIRRLESLLEGYWGSNGEMARRLGPPTVAWCAEQFHLTPSYFGDIVRREIGITPQIFLQNKLLERAKSLLADSSLSINDIAQQLGFVYPNHFARLFRQKTGVSPTAFRKQL
ncbi:MAG: helix-turn-helix transcriptional regulator [Prevotella sp.]|nr:helix-turn-helix transcriptional regulator [Prevotella sp.]